MPMHNKGLTKLMEECGELTQILAKKTAYMDTDDHPDGAGSMKKRIEEELADVAAASVFVAKKLGLDEKAIVKRAQMKLNRFTDWDSDPTK